MKNPYDVLVKKYRKVVYENYRIPALAAVMREGRKGGTMFKHELGVEIEAKVTKLKGIIVARAENLYGCNRYHIQPKVGKEMKVPDGWWIDEDDISVIGKGVVAKPKDTGGLMDRRV